MTEEQLGKLMAEQAEKDNAAMIQKWGKHQHGYSLERSLDGKKNIISRMIEAKLLLQSGESVAEIARLIKSNRSTTYKLINYGKERLPDDDGVLRVMQMLEDGLEISEIARHTGLSRIKIGGIRNSYWLPLKN